METIITRKSKSLKKALAEKIASRGHTKTEEAVLFFGYENETDIERDATTLLNKINYTIAALQQAKNYLLEGPIDNISSLDTIQSTASDIHTYVVRLKKAIENRKAYEHLEYSLLS